jgi:type II secretory pathway component GspD/PulD (secretin)
MRSWPLPSVLGKVLSAISCLLLVVAHHPAAVIGAPREPFAFENVDIKVVVAEVARRTGATFMFDPVRVKGEITVLAPGDVTPAQALDLLRSALALHGYALVRTGEGAWIVPAHEPGRPEFIVRVVPLTYADAGDVAATLAWVAPPGVRIAPYFPTNSVVIAGHVAGVEEMINAIRQR